eukprot:gnl/Dysnectes_brevis/4978_a6955_390.p1 GENE.gnl/Dysnectes_brevis/4978_a6955_390~~gnl/Dysnectes_brevis/4978_a6955_390.p1  ORF type:complete len:216 (+),score=65.48 gnl/Dysnectes_brevis/4978_a6955_390:60-707(+)
MNDATVLTDELKSTIQLLIDSFSELLVNKPSRGLKDFQKLWNHDEFGSIFCCWSPSLTDGFLFHIHTHILSLLKIAHQTLPVRIAALYTFHAFCPPAQSPPRLDAEAMETLQQVQTALSQAYEDPAQAHYRGTTAEALAVLRCLLTSCSVVEARTAPLTQTQAWEAWSRGSRALHAGRQRYRPEEGERTSQELVAYRAALEAVPAELRQQMKELV